jgi:drug/metabolite transporter (DMT)-like permease
MSDEGSQIGEASSSPRAPPPLVEVKAFLGLILLAGIWGLSIPITKLGLADIPPLTLTTLRYAAAAPILALVLVGRPVPRRQMLMRLAVLGLLGIGIGQVAQTLGLTGTSGSIAAIIPIFVVLFGALRLHQAIAARHMAGLFAAFGGIALIALARRDGFAAASALAFLGDLGVLISAAVIALYYVLCTELTKTLGVMAVGAWTCLFGVLALTPFSLWELSAAPMRLTPAAIGVVLYLGLLVTIAGLWIWLTVLQILPVRVAATVQYLQPLIGAAASSFLFGDRLGVIFLLGASLVLLGIALASLPASRPVARPDAASSARPKNRADATFRGSAKQRPADRS